MASRSLWMEVDIASHATPLLTTERCDVVVIGAGIAGISTAYELAKRNLSVIVVDRSRIASGMTARTTAHLSPICDDFMHELKKLRGIEDCKLFYESHAAAVDRIEQIQQSEGIDCDFRRLDGYLFQGKGQPADVLDEEYDVMREVGGPVDRLVGVPLEGCGGRQVLRYPRQGTFHPLKYLGGVVEASTRLGVKFYSETPVEEIVEQGGGVRIKTARADIHAAKAVVTTNAAIADRFAIHTKMAPYRTYAMTFRIRRGELVDALYWDTEDPYHYVRVQPGDGNDDYIIVGGEDHKSGEANDAETRFARLESWVRPLIPSLEEVRHRWSGQVLETIDYAAFIGRNPGNENVFVSTGDSGQGMTHGVLGAMLNADLITTGQSPWTSVYAPDRKPLRSAFNYLRENATALKNFAEYVAPGEVASLEALDPGQGAIVRQGLQKIAAYRDPSGRLHVRSAACTHVGCHLHWNAFEISWDCPCHGSIFDIDGTPLNAPAVSPLAEVLADKTAAAGGRAD